ncbi:MAG TPA: Rieske 2Fe-2S domain-containing protein [Thermomicrobiales bacterium]|nr:Rieske 2Fe-2S domain-containing protein [Thermomicrobiales bacterium]
MTPMVKTLTGLAGGWIAGRAIGMVARLQAGHGVSNARKLHSRRLFTRNAVLGGVGVILLQAGAGFVYLLWPNKTGAFGGEIAVPASSVPPVNGTPFRDTEGKFYIVHTEDGVEALFWKCVHLGCTVPWVEGEHRFHCPCHGSIYEYNGSRVSGPAPRALDAMPVKVDDKGNLTVNTNPSALIQRSHYVPADATPYKA